MVFFKFYKEEVLEKFLNQHFKDGIVKSTVFPKNLPYPVFVSVKQDGSVLFSLDGQVSPKEYEQVVEVTEVNRKILNNGVLLKEVSSLEVNPKVSYVFDSPKIKVFPLLSSNGCKLFTYMGKIYKELTPIRGRKHTTNLGEEYEKQENEGTLLEVSCNEFTPNYEFSDECVINPDLYDFRKASKTEFISFYKTKVTKVGSGYSAFEIIQRRI